MRTKYPTILAVDPGTKELGFAVLEDTHLEYYGVKTFKRRSPPHAFLANASQFIRSLIVRYEPDCLAIEKTYMIQKGSALLNVAAQEAKAAAGQHGLVAHEYDPAQIRNAICRHERATKRESAQIIANRYPELGRFLYQPTTWEALYWAHVFDAIAVGLVCLQDIYEREAALSTPSR